MVGDVLAIAGVILLMVGIACFAVAIYHAHQSLRHIRTAIEIHNNRGRRDAQ